VSQLPNGFVFVLGMHRSGTSCLAGCLERCGLFLGDVSRANEFNARGNHELGQIVQLHEEILAANGGSWREPPAQLAVSERHWEALTDIVTELGRDKPCGFKDPRTLLLIETWLEIVGPAMLVGTYRHPAAVAYSLARRNGLTALEAYYLWNAYNARLIKIHQEYRFPLIAFELDDTGRYCETVASVAVELGLQANRPALREFVDQQLDHSPTLEAELPADCHEAYEYLQQNRYAPR
jgi:hypothetical protein